MYQSQFGLQEAPFALVPDTAYFYAGSCYQEALNTLLLAVDDGGGFVKLTGEVGTGKTMLCRKFLATLDPARYVSAFLPNPCLEPDGVFRVLAEELAIALPADCSQHDLLRLLNAHLLQLADQGKQVVLCLDEAQAMPDRSLEALRLIGNLETEKRKLLQLVLFGQPELDERLARYELRQLQQRITFDYRLNRLSRPELARYLAHRLSTAGYRGGPLFSQAAANALHRASRGVPRLVNVIAHKTLLLIYGRGSDQAGLADVLQAALDTPAALQGHRRWLARSQLQLASWLGVAR